MAVPLRLRYFKFCSLPISSGIAEKITLSVAWVLHRAGSLTLQRLAAPAVQLCEVLQLPDLIRKACDDDVRCSMGATESGFLLTLKRRAVVKDKGLELR